MKITCLVPRHGLSLFIESRDHTLLFDMGPDQTLTYNARNIGIDLTCVDIAFLSHGHMDHGGGVPAFQAANPHAKLVMSDRALDRFYAKMFRIITKDIGLEPDSLDTKLCTSITTDTRISDTLQVFTGFDSFSHRREN